MLFCRLQLVVRIRLGAQPLNGVHHIGLLRENCVTELLCPVQLVAHHLQHVGGCRERFDAFVPSLLVDLVLQRIALEILVLCDPTSRLHDLERIRRGHKDLCQQRVGIESYWGNQRIELFRL